MLGTAKTAQGLPAWVLETASCMKTYALSVFIDFNLATRLFLAQMSTLHESSLFKRRPALKKVCCLWHSLTRITDILPVFNVIIQLQNVLLHNPHTGTLPLQLHHRYCKSIHHENLDPYTSAYDLNIPLPHVLASV